MGDVQIHHVCAEWASPCKHEIAALLELTKAIDDDQNVLLTWRGINLSESQAHTDTGDTPKGQWSSIRQYDGEKKKTIEALRNQLPQQFVKLEDNPSAKSQQTSEELSEFFLGSDKLLGDQKKKISKTIQTPLSDLPEDSELNLRLLLEESLETITEYWLSR